MDKPLIIITGASSGIGAKLPRVFSEAGYSLALMARNLEAMQALNLPKSICQS
jgi:NADP-dependent 3-hydroxy acid dehydrogenase YdfG